MKKELYLVRHGQTDYNKKGIIQGRGIDSDINARGKRQAQAFFDAFGHVPFDKVYISTLKRTRQTLSPFEERGVLLNPHAGLDEMHWGVHEGKRSTTKLKREYNSILSKWQGGELDFRMPEGESPNDLRVRQMAFIDEVIHPFEGKMLICSHGRALRSLICNLVGKSLSEMDQFPHANVSLYKLNFESDRFEIDLFNYREHLLNI